MGVNIFSDEKYERAMAWIKQNLIPRKTPNKYYGAGILKEYLQEDTGIYIPETWFGFVMLAAGFHRDRNGWFNVSNKSPALVKRV